MLGLGRTAVDEVGEIVARGLLQMTDADADQAEPGGAHLKAKQVAAGGEDARGELGRVPERACPRAEFEIGALELQRYGRAGQCVGLEAGRNPFREIPQMMLERAKFADVALEGGFRRNALGVALWIDGARVDPARQMPEAGAFLAVAADEVLLLGALQVGDQPIAVGGELARAHRADAVDEADRLSRQNRRGLVLAERRE